MAMGLCSVRKPARIWTQKMENYLVKGAVDVESFSVAAKSTNKIKYEAKQKQQQQKSA